MLNKIERIFYKYPKSIIFFTLLSFCTLVFIILSLIFDGFSSSVVKRLQQWTGIGSDEVILLEGVTFDILEPAQRRNEYILVTGIEAEGFESTLISLINISTQTINLFPYNFQVKWDEEYKALGELSSLEIENFFREYRLNIIQSFRLDKKALIDKINTLDWTIFSLVDWSGQRVSIRTELRFNQLLKEELTDFTRTENLYYSLVVDYIVKFDPQLEELAAQNIEWKPLHNQRDLGALTEKERLFKRQVVNNRDSIVPFYLQDVRNQYLELLRLDKVTPFITETYKRD